MHSTAQHSTAQHSTAQHSTTIELIESLDPCMHHTNQATATTYAIGHEEVNALAVSCMLYELCKVPDIGAVVNVTSVIHAIIGYEAVVTQVA
jgi:hypothetical protein